MPQRRNTPIADLWRSARIETILAYLGAAVVIVVGILILGGAIGRRIDRFELWIESLGAWAPLAFVAIFAVLNSVFVPDIVLGIIAGATFGMERGVVVAAAGSVAGAIVQYSASRFFFKPAVARFLATRPAWLAVQSAVRRQELKLQLLIRLTPLNRALTSYLLGAAGVGFGRFVVACAALVPALSLEVYVGYVGRHVARIAGEPERAFVFHDITVVAGLGVAVVAMVMISRTARKALDAAAEGES
jgi:uncharacterized membrane protein YdjX (TVP38/TMEM64 family)